MSVIVQYFSLRATKLLYLILFDDIHECMLQLYCSVFILFCFNHVLQGDLLERLQIKSIILEINKTVKKEITFCTKKEQKMNIILI